ncbi:MAG TPA: iron-sulfur cluster assembly accessory protein [Rubricoccaceae bacterium]|jgi:iron-sulfur cluster assembly protein
MNSTVADSAAAPLAAPPPVGRPAPVRLTDRAAAEVRRIIANKQIPVHFGLRVGVKGGGCSGMSYVLGFDKARDHDLTFTLDAPAADGAAAAPITVFMDKRHGLYLMDTTVDYHDGLDARGFVFENPNATATCGCGSSFSA